jgi:hypothetical protein
VQAIVGPEGRVTQLLGGVPASAPVVGRFRLRVIEPGLSGRRASIASTSIG